MAMRVGLPKDHSVMLPQKGKVTFSQLEVLSSSVSPDILPSSDAVVFSNDVTGGASVVRMSVSFFGIHNDSHDVGFA